MTVKISTKSLSGKLNWPSEEREWLSKKCMKLRQKWRPNIWEKKNSDVAFHEINQEFESQRQQPQQANQWADQAQREKISLCRDFEILNRLCRENRAKDSPKIGELRTICCEETDRAGQARIDEWCMHQERNPTTVSQFLAQIHDLQNKMRDNFAILNERAVLERPTFPSQPSTIPSPRTAPRCVSGLPRETRNFTDTSGNICERPPAQEGRSSTFFNNSRIWHHRLRDWDLILQEVQGNKRVRWDENRGIRQYLCHASKVEVEYWIIMVEFILTVVWLITRDVQTQKCIWDFLWTPWNFKAGKSSSRMKFVRLQQIFISQCNGSKKLRWQSQLTNLWHRDWLWVEEFSPTAKCLMRWLRMHWEDFLTSTFTFAREQVSKSSVLRIPTDSFVGDQVHTLRISVQPKPTERHKESQICSPYVYGMMTSKISTLNGIKLCYQRAKYLQMWSWKDCTSQNHRTLFSFRLSWLCTIEKLLNSIYKQFIYDWRRL